MRVNVTQNSTMSTESLPDDGEDLHVNLINNDGMNNESTIECKEEKNYCVFIILIKQCQPNNSVLNQQAIGEIIPTSHHPQKHLLLKKNILHHCAQVSLALLKAKGLIAQGKKA